MEVKYKDVTVKKAFYVASDGTEFDNDGDCEAYEMELLRSKIRMNNYKGYPTKNVSECWSVKLDTQEEVDIFIKLSEYEELRHDGIEGPSVYIYTEGTYGYRNKTWTDVMAIIRDLENGGNDD